MQITVEEVKGYLRLESFEELELLKILLGASISYCEVKLGRPILDENMNETNRWKVPESIRIAVYLLVSHWYENRAPIGEVTKETEFSVSALLGPHRFLKI